MPTIKSIMNSSVNQSNLESGVCPEAKAYEMYIIMFNHVTLKP